MRTKSSQARRPKRNSPAGAKAPGSGRGRNRRSARAADALEYDRKRPNELARASRRSVARTGMTSTGASFESATPNATNASIKRRRGKTTSAGRDQRR